jgi:hypothetical protein
VGEVENAIKSIDRAVELAIAVRDELEFKEIKGLKHIFELLEDCDEMMKGFKSVDEILESYKKPQESAFSVPYIFNGEDAND